MLGIEIDEGVKPAIQAESQYFILTVKEHVGCMFFVYMKAQPLTSGQKIPVIYCTICICAMEG
jgi:hypothetical protein